MAWQKHEAPATGEQEDRRKLEFAIGLDLTGTVDRITGRKPSKFGGEVRYVDLTTEDGEKVSFGVGGWKLERFEAVGYQVGDGLRVTITEVDKKDGSGTRSEPTFYVNRGVGGASNDLPSEPTSDYAGEVPF